MLYKTDFAVFAIKEGISFRIFDQCAFRHMFEPFNPEVHKIVEVSCKQLREEVLRMGQYAMNATNDKTGGNEDRQRS